jgi:hypothetical protein
MEAFPASRKFVADWVEDCKFQTATEWKVMMETVARIYPDFEVVSILLDKAVDALDREEMVRIAFSHFLIKRLTFSFSPRLRTKPGLYSNKPWASAAMMCLQARTSGADT